MNKGGIMKFKNIVVCGGGVLGSQIAFQTAFSGFDVTIWLIDEEAKKQAIEKIENLKKVYIDTIKSMAGPDGKSSAVWAMGIADPKKFNKEECLKKVEKAYKGIKFEIDLQKAVASADLVIESIVENLKLKNEFYKKLSRVLPEKTIVVTNSSTLLPSKMAKATGRPEKYLSLHFANAIWKNNTAEVMCHPKTNKESFEAVIKFAKDIKMIALPLLKEKSGYLLNSMLVPLLFSAMDLLVNDISDVESIDTAWKKGTGAPRGPFEILDVVGVVTAYNIVKMYLKIPAFLAPYNFKKMAACLKKMMDENKLGKATGEGFYKYKK